MLYLDANVFVHAAIDQGARGARASELLRSIAQGEVEAFTGVLTIDEVAWSVGRKAERSVGIGKGHQMLAFPNLKVVPVTPADMRRALHLMEDHKKLAPRDAMHAALAIAGGADHIVTDDRDFEGIPGLPRKGLA